MNISLEDRRKILARGFFNDNRGDYKSWEEALKELEESVNESFINFGTEWVDRSQEPGHRLVMNDVGHVAKVRDEDGFFSPLTEMTEEEGSEIEAAFQKAAEEFPHIESGMVLLQKAGWKLL